MRISELPLWRFLLGMSMIGGWAVVHLVLHIVSDQPLYPFFLLVIALGLGLYLRRQQD